MPLDRDPAAGARTAPAARPTLAPTASWTQGRELVADPMNATLEAAANRESPVRERILGTAYELFARRGMRDVGINELVDRAGITKATLYRHFPSKDDLVVAFLELREQRWTRGGPRPDAAAAPPRSSCWRSSTCSTSRSTATTSKPARSLTCCSSSELLTQPAERASSTWRTSARSYASSPRKRT